MEIARLWFDFKGRFNRGKFWFITIANCIIFVAFILIAMAAKSDALMMLAFLIALPLFISSLAVSVKRLHDRDKSAWWLLLFYLLPIVFGVIKDAFAMLPGSASFTLAVVFAVLSGALSLWAVVELGCLRGTTGANRYGPNPLA